MTSAESSSSGVPAAGAASPGAVSPSTGGRVAESRAERFSRELADLKISDPSAGHPRLWQRLGATLMVLGIVFGVTSYLISHRTTSALTQGDAITIGLGGVTLAVIGGAIFLRYSLTGFLRFWMARQSFEMNILAERFLTASAHDTTPNGKDIPRNFTRTDT
jgi:hypothetical protein